MAVLVAPFSLFERSLIICRCNITLNSLMSKKLSRLVADIGGTNTRFALLNDGLIHSEKVLKGADYPDLEVQI